MNKNRVKPTDTLSEKNYRDFAHDAIKAYFDKGMLLDGMLWSSVIGYYEQALKEKEAK